MRITDLEGITGIGTAWRWAPPRGARVAVHCNASHAAAEAV